MRKKLKHAFIPHHGNNYKPSLFEYASISSVLVVGIIFFLSSMATHQFVANTEQGAAVYASVLVDLTNKSRVENNGAKLVISETLTKAAQMKAEDMASKQYFAHTSPDGTTPWYWFQKAGYNFVYAGENLAVDFHESADIQNAWLLSPKHRDNIVDTRFREIGIATKTADWQGRQTIFVVQLFGTPAKASSTPLALASENNSESKPDAKVAGAKIEEVAGAKTGEIVVLDEKKNIEGNTVDSTIIVENQSAIPEEHLAESSEINASFFEKAIVQLPAVTSTALMALSAMILLGLILFIFIEIRKQHPKHVIVGIFVFAIMSSLAYASYTYILPV